MATAGDEFFVYLFYVILQVLYAGNARHCWQNDNRGDGSSRRG